MTRVETPRLHIANAYRIVSYHVNHPSQRTRATLSRQTPRHSHQRARHAPNSHPCCPYGTALHIHLRQLDHGVVLRGEGAVHGAIPAVRLEALRAHARHGGRRAVEAAAEDRAGDARGPRRVDGGVGAGGDGVAVGDDGVALAGVVAGVEGGDVGVVDVGRVGDVDDERGGGGGVGGVAAEEGRAGVEAEVDEGVLVRDGGEGGAVGDTGGVEGALVGGDEGGAVRPVVGRVGGGVDGEDDVDGAGGLDEWVEGDVLQVFAAVDKGEGGGLGDDGGTVVEAEEGVGGVGGDVVVVIADIGEEVGEDGFECGGDAGGVDVEEEGIEEGRGRAHYVAD